MRRFLFVIIATVLWSKGAAYAETTAAPAPSGCNTAESRQFDFWIGNWDVARAQAPGKKIANSRIEKLYAGCAVRENWMPLRPNVGGGSLNAYDQVQKKWRQFWIDSDGGIIEFSGDWNGKTMVLEGPISQPGQPPQTKRMTFTPRADGSVEQVGQTSSDGKVWAPEYDLIYKRSRS